MRKIGALLLALGLALTALGASATGVAALDYTLDEKFVRQVRDGSGLRLSVLFEKTGGNFTLLDEPANAMLNTLLPGSELSLRYLRGVGTIRGMMEVDVSLVRSGQTLVNARYGRDPQFEEFTTSLLPGAQYVDALEGGALLALFTGQNPAWPPLETLLLGLFTAESSWQAEANAKLDEYAMRLSLWLQGYAATESVRAADNTLQTRVVATVPAQALKEQAKSLLSAMYGDTALLLLLSREMNAGQAAAYLQPTMLPGLSQALDMMPLTGDLVSERVMDAQGAILQNRLTLPMGGVYGIDRLTYAFDATRGGGETALVVEYAPTLAGNVSGRLFTLLVYGGPDAAGGFSYSGTMSFVPEAGGGESFTVGAEQVEMPADVYDFALAWVPSPEIPDDLNGTSSRDLAFTLTFNPREPGAIGAQTFSVNLSLSGRQHSQAATNVTGTIVWEDAASAARLAGTITGATAAPWNIPEVDHSQAIHLEELTAQQLMDLNAQVVNALATNAAALLFSLAVPNVNQ